MVDLRAVYAASLQRTLCTQLLVQGHRQRRAPFQTLTRSELQYQHMQALQLLTVDTLSPCSIPSLAVVAIHRSTRLMMWHMHIMANSAAGLIRRCKRGCVMCSSRQLLARICSVRSRQPGTDMVYKAGRMPYTLLSPSLLQAGGGSKSAGTAA